VVRLYGRRRYALWHFCEMRGLAVLVIITMTPFVASSAAGDAESQ